MLKVNKGEVVTPRISSTRLICASFGSTRLICASFGSTRLICASFGSTRLICASFESTRLIGASLGITRLIGVSFRITRLICAFYGTTRLLCRVRAQRGADRREAGRMREGHMDASVSSDIVLYGCGLIYHTMLDGIPGNSHDTDESKSQMTRVILVTTNPGSARGKFSGWGQQGEIPRSQTKIVLKWF
ncbi:hypothetical protein E5676_scaffold284G00920 [Cucumis melo var. makuwa]|uniref:DNA-directed RNA polymerase I subunit RPA1-like n=1 Tax=Cucumis melo var. makuwa TaxID=1194695 RepID=A0A5D3DBJ0_CUCMM|nr:hypothetical protein E5676_scaffold284G00920 [Cucumis melo var. makuwa]